MSAVLLLGHGGFDRLVYRHEVRVPVPLDDEVLVRVGAAGVNNTDINLRVGWYSKSVQDGTASPGSDDAGWTGSAVAFPLIQGADVCGVVAATGAGVDPARIGQRVLVDPVLRSRRPHPRAPPPYLGSDCNGGFAEFVCVPAENAHPIDSARSDAELASFPCSYSAAANMLARAAVRAGDVVLVTGASGGVGSAAVQLARRRGAHVIAVAAAAKTQAVAALGAARVLPRDADLAALLGRDSVDVVIDSVGGAQFPGLLEALRSGGRYAVAGAIAGPVVPLDLRMLYLKDLCFFGCTVPDPAVFVDLVEAIEAGLAPVIAATYPLRAMAEAQRDFLEKRHVGKIVLLP